MNKNFIKKAIEIYAGIYYLFSLVASCLLLVKIVNHFNIYNSYVDYLIYILCLCGNFAILYVTLKDDKHFDKEKKQND